MCVFLVSDRIYLILQVSGPQYMEDGNNGFILHVGKHVMYEGNPPELSDSRKLAKKTSWRKRIEEIRCVVAPMVDQRLFHFCTLTSTNT